MRVKTKKQIVKKQLVALLSLKTQDEVVQKVYDLVYELWACDQLTDDGLDEMTDAILTICENNKLKIPVDCDGCTLGEY